MRRLLLPCLLLLAAAGCNRDPVGFSQLDRVPDIIADTLLPDTMTSYGKYVPLGAAGELVLGRDNQYLSRSLLQFTFPDSVLDSITAVQLILHPADSTVMAFACRPCSTPWSSGGMTWKMADSQNQWLRPGGDYWPFLLAQDTLRSDSLIVDLDLRYLDTLAHASYGVILFPLDTGFARIGSNSSDKTAPRLKITYADGGTKLASIPDAAHAVESLDIRTNPQDLLVGSSVVFRTMLRFDLDSTPDSLPASATIVRGELRFNPVVVYRRTDTLHFGVHRLSEPFAPRGRSAQFRTAADARTIFVQGDSADTTVVLDVRDLLQFWTAHPDSNYGLLLSYEPEYAIPARARIPRTGPGAPRLVVEYVLPPEDRFAR